MPPKKAATAAKATTAKGSHPSYQDMIKEAVISLKERNGSSRQAVKKYVLANNNLGSTTDAQFTAQFNRALSKGSESGVFARPKGTSGPVKLGAPTKATESKPAAKATTTTTKAPAAKKTAATKKTTTTTTTTTKAPAAKKAAGRPPKATSTKKAPAAKKVTATKSKANTGKARKTTADAPAVEEKAPVVLGKTKSGRVTKSNAPQPIQKTTAPKKKAAATKKAAPKKTSTPKSKA